MKVINVMAASIDGRIGLQKIEGDIDRQAAGISGESDQKFLRMQIESCDAIIVGASSIRANGECLEHPGIAGTPPTWFIFTEHDLDMDIPFWSQDRVPRVLVSKDPIKIPSGSKVKNLVYGNNDPCDFLVGKLNELGTQQALLFGGGIINRWFYNRELVDELRLTLSPLIVGRSDAPLLVAPELSNIVKFSLLTSHVEESFVFLTYQVRR